MQEVEVDKDDVEDLPADDEACLGGEEDGTEEWTTCFMPELFLQLWEGVVELSGESTQVHVFELLVGFTPWLWLLPIILTTT